jgi:GNAT superfamily N-acetyltransferase
MTSTRLEPLVRRARSDEAEALNELIMRAKAYWGYDQPFLDACRPLLILQLEEIERDYVYCAEVAGTLAGISHFKVLSDAEIDFDHLFVEPAFIGQGIGALLWRHAVNVARSIDAKALVFGADPHARPFYEHMGAVVVGESISTIIAGRRLPRMRYEW